MDVFKTDRSCWEESNEVFECVPGFVRAFGAVDRRSCGKESLNRYRFPAASSLAISVVEIFASCSLLVTMMNEATRRASVISDYKL